MNDSVTKKKTIFLVDDHPMMREGVARMIRESGIWEVCGQASSAMEAMDEILKARPDLIIMDISLPDKSGLELIKDLNAKAYGLNILVFSMHDEFLYAERVMRAGAKGYLTKDSPTESLPEAIECVLQGKLYLSRDVSDHILKTLSRTASGQVGIAKLSDRELEIFELIGRCKTNAQIAEKLNISARTVDAHRSNIRAKLSLPDAPTLMREAVLWVELVGKGPNAEPERSA
jgi:DNA-binding NarL/FixJ family response regulator